MNSVYIYALILKFCVLVKITCDSEWELKNIDCNISICFIFFYIFFLLYLHICYILWKLFKQTSLCVSKRPWFGKTYSDFWLVIHQHLRILLKKEVWLHLENTMMTSRTNFKDDGKIIYLISDSSLIEFFGEI